MYIIFGVLGLLCCVCTLLRWCSHHRRDWNFFFFYFVFVEVELFCHIAFRFHLVDSFVWLGHHATSTNSVKVKTKHWRDECWQFSLTHEILNFWLEKQHSQWGSVIASIRNSSNCIQIKFVSFDLIHVREFSLCLKWNRPEVKKETELTASASKIKTMDRIKCLTENERWKFITMSACENLRFYFGLFEVSKNHKLRHWRFLQHMHWMGFGESQCVRECECARVEWK